MTAGVGAGVCFSQAGTGAFSSAAGGGTGFGTDGGGTVVDFASHEGTGPACAVGDSFVRCSVANSRFAFSRSITVSALSDCSCFAGCGASFFSFIGAAFASGTGSFLTMLPSIFSSVFCSEFVVFRLIQTERK